MSWDLAMREYVVYGKLKEDKKKELNEYLEKIKATLGKKLHISTKSEDEEVLVVIMEEGMYKYGWFRGAINDANSFIENIINIDKENIEVELSNDGWCETDSNIYYYKDGNIKHTTRKAREFEKVKNNKEELIKKIKDDIYYFEALDDEEMKNIEYQKASMYASYPSYTWEFGTEDFDKLYSDEFVKSEEALVLAFKLGTRDELFKKRILPNFINNISLLKALLPLNPRYIRYMPKELKKDKELVLSLIEGSKKSCCNNIDAMHIDISLRNDKEVMSKLCEASSSSFLYASEELKKDYDYCNQAAKQVGFTDFTSIKNDKVINENIVKVISSVHYIGDSNDLPDIKITEELQNDLSMHKELFKHFIKLNAWDVKLEEKTSKLNNEIDATNSIEELFFLCYRNPSFSIPELYYCMLPNWLIKNEAFIKKVVECNKTRKIEVDELECFLEMEYDKLKVVLNDQLIQDVATINMLQKNKIEILVKPQFITTKEGVVAMLTVKRKNNKPNKIALKDLNDDLRNNLDVQKEYVIQKGNYEIKEINVELLKNKKLRKLAFENVYLGLGWLMQGEYGYFTDEEPSVDGLQTLLYIKELTNFNYEDLLHLVKSEPLILLYTKENYFDDKKMIIEATKKNMDILRYVDKALLKDKDVLNAALKSERVNYKIFEQFDTAFSDKKIALKLMKKAPQLYEKLNDELKQDDEIINYAKEYEYNIRYFPQRYKEDAEFVFSVLGKKINTEWILKDYYKTECDEEKTRVPLFSEKLLNNKEFMLKMCAIDPGSHNSNELHMLSDKELLKDPDYLKEVINIRAARYKMHKSEYINLPKTCMKMVGKDEKRTLEELFFILLNQDVGEIYFAEYMNNNVDYYKKYLVKQGIINSELDLDGCTTFEEVIDKVMTGWWYSITLKFPANLLKNERIVNYILSKYNNDYIIEDGKIVFKLKNKLTDLPLTANDFVGTDEKDTEIYNKYLKQKELILAGETDVNKIVYKEEIDEEEEDDEYEEDISEYFDDGIEFGNMEESEEKIKEYNKKFEEYFVDNELDDEEDYDAELPF